LLPTRRVAGSAAIRASPETGASSASGAMTSISTSSPGRFSGACTMVVSVTGTSGRARGASPPDSVPSASIGSSSTGSMRSPAASGSGSNTGSTGESGNTRSRAVRGALRRVTQAL